MTKRHRLFFGLVIALAAFLLNPNTPMLRGRPTPARWVTAWTTSQQELGRTSITNATVRMIARVTIPGDAVRIRLDNTFGAAPLKVGDAYVGARVQGPELASSSNQPVLFNHSASVIVPAGGSVESDPVFMKVLAWQDLAISLYIPEAEVLPSQHTNAVVTSYLSENGSGDVSADETRANFKATTTSMFWLKAIDVLTSSPAMAVIVFGDSITDGTCTTLDAHDRWEDWLEVRLQQSAHATGTGSFQMNIAILNEGIGGNTITREGMQPPPDSPTGMERLDRDVLSHYGVRDVILFMGTNDIRRNVPGTQVIGGMQDIIKRVKTAGLKIIGVTIIPRHNLAPTENNSGWNPEKTRIRNEVNQWIRSQAAFDALIDFDQVVRDPANPDRLQPAFNCGDGIHPSPLGYYEMGSAVPLNLFTGDLKPPSASTRH